MKKIVLITMISMFCFCNMSFGAWSNDPTANTEICINDGNTLYSVQPISDGSGGAIISWRDNRNVNDAIYAQRIDSSGNVQWTANGVTICSTPNHQALPRLISDGSGGAIIVWGDSRSDVRTIYAQRIDSTGAIKWAENGVAICTAADDQWYPQLISDGSGGAIITWGG